MVFGNISYIAGTHDKPVVSLRGNMYNVALSDCCEVKLNFFFAHSYKGFAQMKTIFHKEAKFSIEIRSFRILQYLIKKFWQKSPTRKLENFKKGPLNFLFVGKLMVLKIVKINLCYRGLDAQGGVCISI